ncbi:MAG: hypothetical protein ABIR46_04505, partial [Candidatus Saccharimonadales bacterium]
MKRLTGALLLTLIMSCFSVLVPSSPANALQGDVLWSHALDTTYVSGSGGSFSGTGVVTHGDGSVTATACGTNQSMDDAQSRTLSATKDVVGNITGLQDGAICYGRGVTGLDGTLFYTERLNMSNYNRKVVVTKNGTRIAEHSFTYQCNGTGTVYYAYPDAFTIGADGNAYALLNRSSCTNTPSQLLSLNVQTGQVRFLETLSSGAKYQSYYSIGVYDSGVVVAEDNTSQSAPDLLTYYSYAGAKNETLSCSIDGTTDACGFSLGGASIGTVTKLSVKLDGTVYLETYKYATGTCPVQYRTLKYTMAGVATSTVRPSVCTGTLLDITPQGYLLYYYNYNVVVMDDSGVVQYQGALNSKPGYVMFKYPGSNEIMMDSNGNIYAMRIARLNAATNARNIYFDRLNTDGTWTTEFSTEQLPNPNGDKFYVDPARNVLYAAFGEDSLYMAI